MADVNVRRIGFRQGWQWIIIAADQIIHQPHRYLLPAAWLVALSSLQWLVPGIGLFFSGLLAPLAIAPLLLTYAQFRNEGTLDGLSGIERAVHRPMLYRLLRLGLYLMLIVLAASQLTGSLLSALLPEEVVRQINEQNLPELIQIEKRYLMLLLALTALPMAMLGLSAWFSVPLVIFHEIPVLRALAMSLMACAINYRALLALTLSLVVIMLGGMLILVIISLVVGALSPEIAILLNLSLMLIASVFLQMSLAGAQYLAYVQIFDHGEGPIETGVWTA